MVFVTEGIDEYLNQEENVEFLPMQCPACGNEDAKLIQRLLQIPYYDDFHMISFFCKKCGLRKTDFANINSKGHTRYEYFVENLEDFTTKVVRAENGVVTIPELGVKIEPARNPQTWIRNVEGILLDIKEKVGYARDMAETEDQRKAAIERLKLIDEALEGKVPFTIIVEDVTGNSIIIPAKKEKLKIEILEGSSE
ncbi:MAG: ZPR1 zinc finger domain-containing protein [Methanobacteriota archaeon]|nr:MAG: ZPR1 zinc finger domain-containing protein [Euryarchaeota archaeon]